MNIKLKHCLFEVVGASAAHRWFAHPCCDEAQMEAIRASAEVRLCAVVRLHGSYTLLDELLAAKREIDPWTPESRTDVPWPRVATAPGTATLH